MESTTAYQPFEENEISINAKGGTELMKRRIAERVDPEIAKEFQIIASRVRQLHEDKIRIYWVHDLPSDIAPEIKDDNLRNRFHKIVFCGNWQYNHFLDRVGLPVDHKLMVIDNGIVPIPEHKKPEDEINLVYFSTPQRGLAILVPVFKNLAEKYPNIKLHVCSSFKIYGMEQIDEQEQFKGLFEECKNHPQIVYHGTKTNDEMRELLQKMHIFAYPSIWPECNSLAAIESMSAQLLCVAPNYAGLSDTFGGLVPTYQWNQDLNVHAAVFHGNLEHAINNIHTDGVRNFTRFVKAYADNRFHIDKIGTIWNGLLTNMAGAHKDLESRKLPAKKFKYDPFG